MKQKVKHTVTDTAIPVAQTGEVVRTDLQKTVPFFVVAAALYFFVWRRK